MACRDAYQANTADVEIGLAETSVTDYSAIQNQEQLLFGVDSEMQANDVLQNNLTVFDWVTRNKLYPNFWVRNINGKNCLSREEIEFIHDKGCMVAALYSSNTLMEAEEQGELAAAKAVLKAIELGIPKGTALFLEIPEEGATREFLLGFAKAVLEDGYVPAFKANTDSECSFDREFSSAKQVDKSVMDKCLIWATAPCLPEYNGITTTHLLHPDQWKPYAPSNTTRNEIAVWQYGVGCHPILDDEGEEVTFNLNLAKDKTMLIRKMF